MALFGSVNAAFGGGGGMRGGSMGQMQPKQPWMQQQKLQQQQPGLGPSPQMGTAESGQMPQQPQNKMNREQWRDAWMGAGKMSPQQADQWLQSHGATQMQGGGKAGRWTTPHGEALDLQIARGAAMAGKRGGMITPGWTRMKGVRGGGQQQGQEMGQGLGPSMGMGGYDNRQGMPPGTYGGGMPPWMQNMGGMGSTPGHWGNSQTSLPWGQMGGGGMSRTQQMMGGGMPQAQQMPQRSTPWGQVNRMQPQRMGGY